MKVTLPITVVAFETDFGGVVSNTRYLEYIERGRYALLHAAGLKVKDIWREHGVQPAVRRVEVDYLGFARHEDELELEVECVECGRVSVTLKYLLRRLEDGAVLMRATQTLAFINARMKPSRTPTWFAAKFSAGEHGELQDGTAST
jgi:YbgC/YbaW family acyl-CoA thioester hydrolase